MKIRDGFVSNSSSASFIVRAKSFRDVFDLASKMIPRREWNESGLGNDHTLMTNIRLARRRGMDPNTPICFDSCNYETYIATEGPYFLVATCNNTDWQLDEHLVILSTDEREWLVQKFGADDGADYDFLQFSKFLDGLFWYPEYNLIGRHHKLGEDPYSYNRAHVCCDHHKFTFMLEDESGNVFCPACKRGRKVKT